MMIRLSRQTSRKNEKLVNNESVMTTHFKFFNLKSDVFMNIDKKHKHFKTNGTTQLHGKINKRKKIKEHLKTLH